MKWRSRFIITILLGMFSSHMCMAAGTGDFRTTKVNVFQTYFSGEDNLSFGKGSPGYGVEFFRDDGGNIFRGYIKGRFGTASGTQNFLDSSTAVSAQYNFYFGHGELGALLFPIPRRENGTNLFLGGGGFVSYNLLNLVTSATVTELKTNQQAIGYGYSGSVGVEMILSDSGSKHYMGTFEMVYRQEQTPLAGQTAFDLSGLSIAFGFGW